LRLLEPARVGTAHRAPGRVRDPRGALAPARAAPARRSAGAAQPRCAAERAGSRARSGAARRAYNGIGVPLRRARTVCRTTQIAQNTTRIPIVLFATNDRR